jgi:hypothetical protein
VAGWPCDACVSPAAVAVRMVAVGWLAALGPLTTSIQSGNRVNMCNVGIARNGWGSLIIHYIQNVE